VIEGHPPTALRIVRNFGDDVKIEIVRRTLVSS